MPKPEKIEKVKSLKEYLENAKSVFVTDYSGLNVADITVLRKNLRDNSVKYVVAKNTLMRIAAKEAGYENLVEYLKRPTAVAFTSDDPAVPAKILYDSFKEKEKPVIKAFVLDKELFSGTEIRRLADLPSREVLLAQLVSAIESPINSLISNIDGVFQELIATIETLAKTK